MALLIPIRHRKVFNLKGLNFSRIRDREGRVFFSKKFGRIKKTEKQRV